MFKWATVLLLLFASVCVAKDETRSRPVKFDEAGERWAAKTLKKMSLEEKVGQLFMPWSRVAFYNIEGPEYAQMRSIIDKYHVGGFGVTVGAEGPLVFRNQPYEAAMMLNQLQHESKVPLIFGADFERGLFMRLNGTTGFPHAMAFGATGNKDFAFAAGKITAEEARAIGVHWNWFPDADVNSNPRNPIINTRAFGEDPQAVSEMVTAYIAGARGSGMLTTVKHFPGHGDTGTDTHLALARTDATRERLSTVELVPFRDAIGAGVDAVMVSHVIVPALEPDPNKPAVISQNIINGQLRHRMGFEGLIVTDAMDMAGVMKIYNTTPAQASARAAVDAIKAGVDMVLIPADIDAAYNGVLNAVRSKEIPESQIEDSVLRVLKAKASVGLNKNREVDIDDMAKIISRPQNLAMAQQIADESVTLVRDGGLLPLKINGTSAKPGAYQTVQARNRLLAVVFTDDIRGETGRVFASQLRVRVPDANIMYIDARTAPGMTPLLMKAMREADTIVAAVSVIPSGGRVIKGATDGSVDLGGDQGSLLKTLLAESGGKMIFLTLGNPYVVSEFPETQTYMTVYSNAPVSETAAVKALFGEIAIRGHLPVTIPGIAARGFGIERPAVRAAK